MRIISGEFKGRKLQPPKNLPVRPTTDMAKEALFNILNNRYYFDELKVLDLFAGTGSISFEFASRGCEDITAIDAHYNCVKFIEKTSEAFQMDINVIKGDCFKFLESSKQAYDIIFADPPYNFSIEQFSSIPNLVFSKDLLNEDGLLIVEHSKQTNLENEANYSYSKSYGGNVFSFFNHH